MILVRALIALVIFAVVAAIADAVCRHFGIDTFWGWIVGVICALIYFFGYHSTPPAV